MVGTNLFGPHISGPNLMLPKRTSQNNVQIFLVDMSADSSPILGPKTKLETTKIYSLLWGSFSHKVDIQV